MKRKSVMRLRRQASKHLKVLHLRQKGCCFWCNQPTIREATIREENRIGHILYALHYREDGQIKHAAIASVDHVIPLEYGGDSQIDNLVMACHYCNTKRSEKPRELHTCRGGCGKVLRRKICRPCNQLRKVAA